MKFSPALLTELSTCVRQRRSVLRKLASKLALPGPHSPGCNTAAKLQAKRRERRAEQRALRVQLKNLESSILTLTDLAEPR